MLSKLTFLMNAAVLGGLAGFAAHTVAPISPSFATHGGSATGQNPITTRSVPTQTVTPPSFIRSGALPGATGPKVANLLPSASSDAVVPPIVRRAPANGTSVASAEQATEKKTTKKSKADTAQAKGTKPASEISGTVKTASASPRNNQPIDLSGRSALGAAPKGVQGAAPKGTKCNAGLKYDAKQLKCVAVPAKEGAAQKVAKVAAPGSTATAKP